jgi:nucleoside 2-deoxyribosyltransferase
MISSLYLIGSLRNPKVPALSHELRRLGFEVFDDWYAAGPEADDYWQRYETQRGRTYAEALNGSAATHVFRYDRSNLDRCDAAVLLLPAGKSGHLELGYVIGKGKPAFIFMPEGAERWDVMYRFANMVVTTVPELEFAIRGAA